MNEKTTALIITLNIMIHSGAILLKIPPTQLFFVGLLFFYLPPPACLKRPTPLLYA